MSNEPTNRVPAGVPTGGQFAASAKSESGVALAPTYDPADTSDVTDFDRAAEHINRFPMLYYVDRGDEFTPEEVDDFLAGDTMGVYNTAVDRFEENAYRTAENEAEQAWTAAFEAGDVAVEWDELDYDDQSEFRQRVYDKDDCDLVADLARNTPDQLMRTHLDGDIGSRILNEQNSAWHGLSTFNEDGPEAEERRQTRYNLVGSALARHGIDDKDPAVAEAVRELVDNGPYDWHDGVSLDVIFYDDIATAAPDATPGSTTSLTFNDAQVVLIDTYNGSGHDVRIPGTLTRQFAPMPDEGGIDAKDRVFADKGPSSGMSWDSVCGLHKPAYRTGVTRNVTPGDDQRAVA